MDFLRTASLLAVALAALILLEFGLEAFLARQGCRYRAQYRGSGHHHVESLSFPNLPAVSLDCSGIQGRGHAAQ